MHENSFQLGLNKFLSPLFHHNSNRCHLFANTQQNDKNQRETMECMPFSLPFCLTLQPGVYIPDRSMEAIPRNKMSFALSHIGAHISDSANFSSFRLVSLWFFSTDVNSSAIGHFCLHRRMRVQFACENYLCSIDLVAGLACNFNFALAEFSLFSSFLRFHCQS